MSVRQHRGDDNRCACVERGPEFSGQCSDRRLQALYEPKMLAFLSAGSVAISGQYAAENGKVYMVSQKAGAVTIEAKVGEKEE